MTVPADVRSDATLCALAAGELPYVTAAFEILIRRHQASVSRFCRRMLRDPDRAEDATQETLIRAFHALPHFERRADFRTWLFSIARNVCLTRLKQAAAEAQLREQYLREQTLVNTPGSVSTDEATLDIEEVLASMPLEDREILALRFVASLSLQEIADSQAVSLSAAKMRLYRAIEQLRERIRASDLKCSLEP
jgi:RNA polymerase sigma-70 factor, ECF subfamily